MTKIRTNGLIARQIGADFSRVNVEVDGRAWRVAEFDVPDDVAPLKALLVEHINRLNSSSEQLPLHYDAYIRNPAFYEEALRQL